MRKAEGKECKGMIGVRGKVGRYGRGCEGRVVEGRVW